MSVYLGARAWGCCRLWCCGVHMNAKHACSLRLCGWEYVTETL